MSEEKPRILLDPLKIALKENQGVFLGEEHMTHIIQPLVMSNLTELKAAGVTTIYIEFPEQAMQALRNGQDFANSYLGDAAIDPVKYSMYGQLMLAAQQQGIRVIGYEDFNPLHLKASDTPTQMDEKVLQYATSAEAIDRRDKTAEYVIRATQDGGKYIIMGGSKHSRIANLDPDAPSAGLDVRLGIPSIDVVSPTVAAELHQAGEFISPALIKGGAALVDSDDNYEVILPEDGSASLIFLNKNDFAGYAYIDEPTYQKSLEAYKSFLLEKDDNPVSKSQGPVLTQQEIDETIAPYIGRKPTNGDNLPPK